VYIRLAIKAGFLYRTTAAVFDPSNKQQSRAAEYRFVNITETSSHSLTPTPGHKEYTGTQDIQGCQGIQGNQGTEELAILTNRNGLESQIRADEGEGRQEQEVNEELSTRDHKTKYDDVLGEADNSTTDRLFELWQSLITPRNSLAEPLTFATKSRLVAFEKVIGSVDAPFVLQCAVSNWDEFRDMAFHRGDITPTPSTTSLVEYCWTAYRVYVNALPRLSAGSSDTQKKTRADIIAVVERWPWENFEILRVAVEHSTVHALAEQVSHLPKRLQWDGGCFQDAEEDEVC